MKDYINSKNIFILAFAGLIIGLLYSRFLISLSMVLFLIGALAKGDLMTEIKCFFSNKYFIAVTMIFFIFLVTGLWSENTDYFLNRMRIKLPFLFLPFAFHASARLTYKDYRNLILVFITVIAISILWSLFQFSLDFSHYVDIYKKGQILPTPIHHIRYSILVTISILFGIYLLQNKNFKINTIVRNSLIAVVVIMIMYQHLLAVRSGLMTLYIVFAATIVLWSFKKQNRKHALTMLIMAIVLAGVSVKYVPTVKNKIGYMRYSLEKFKNKDNIRHLSDSRRLGSIYAGLSLMQQHPMLGVGIGDIMDETNNYLEEHYPALTELELLPHNQFILTGASCGILLMLVFIMVCLLPLLYAKGYSDLLVLGTHLIFLSSFMVEHTLESQIGVAAYSFIVLFVMKYQFDKSEYEA